MDKFIDDEQGFRIIVKEKEGILYLTIPEMGLFVKGHDISMLYQEINDQKESVLKQYRDLGLSSELKSFHKPKASNSIVTEFAKFIFKSAFITLLSVVIFLTTISFVFTKAVVWLSPHNVRTITYVVIDRLEQIPPEKMEKYKGWVRRYVVVLKPLTDELKPLFIDPLESKVPTEPLISN